MDNKISIQIDNCMDCGHHQVEPDPDPNDWFCDDDVRVVCRETGKDITIACRPYDVRRECKIPSWCPFLKQ